MKQAHIFFAAVVIAGAAAAATTWPLTRGVEAPARPAESVAESPEVAAPPAPSVTAPVAPRSAQRTAREHGAELRRLGTMQAEAALAAWHSTFVEKCWNPSAARTSAPEHIDLRFNLAFDPSGALVGLGISDNRRAYRSDVSACLRGLSVKLKIPAPGAPLQVQVPLTLP